MRGWQTGIYRCDKGDPKTWKQLHDRLPSGDITGRISLAIAPSQPDTVYALVSDPLGSEVLGVYRSRSRGDRWTEIGGTEFAAEDQGECHGQRVEGEDRAHPPRGEQWPEGHGSICPY